MSAVGGPAGEANAATGRAPDVVRLADVRSADVATVGGKAANLGEMIGAKLPVPPGFVVTTAAYDRFLASNELTRPITVGLTAIDADDDAGIRARSAELRARVVGGVLPADLEDEIDAAFTELVAGTDAGRVAVRSSATAEDAAEYSFAGMFETVLNVGTPEQLHDALRRCWASALGERVLVYRARQRLPLAMPVAVVVQRMVDAEKSGVMFTADPASGDRSHIVIEGVWGLGEAIVQGAVTPDHYVLDKASSRTLTSEVAAKEFLLRYDAATNETVRVDLADDPKGNAPVLTARELGRLADLARRAEGHYGKPQDMEFAIVGDTVLLTQSRPITTLRETPTNAATPEARVLVHGLGASPGRAAGAVRLMKSSSDGTIQPGEVLVAPMTSPDWVPAMRRAAAIVTDAGGMTSHAAIVARELGVPCVVGTHDATRVLASEKIVTVDGSAGVVLAGDFVGERKSEEARSPTAPRAPTAPPLVTATKLYVNLAEPSAAASVAAMDVDGIGLLRAEFMMLEALEHIHPREFLHRHTPDDQVKRMADALRTYAAAFTPRPIIYRAIDLRSNEFRGLEGGAAHEPNEANPMIGYRGCFRYTKEPDLFALELRALADVRKQYDNVHLMIPFVRTERELATCLALVDASALRDDATLERWIMAEVPSVVYLLRRYARLGIHGVSIGSNDLTQLMLGVDRDSALFGPGYDERDESVVSAIRDIIAQCRTLGITCSICGQAPSIHADYAAQLVEWGIDSISVNVDAIDRTRRNIATAEQRILLAHSRTSARAQADGDGR